MNNLALALIPAMPLLAAILLLGTKHRPHVVYAFLSSGAVFISTVIILFLGAAPRSSTPLTWLNSAAGWQLSFQIGLNALSWWMSFIVSSVALAVLGQSYFQMKEDPSPQRFYVWMLVFVASMLTLVMAKNLMTLFFAWEIVGLCSWALIGFWYHKPEAQQAARKAFLMTRTADFGLLLAIIYIQSRLGTTDLDTLSTAVAGGTFLYSETLMIASLILLGALGKSAQLPFSAWLPDAMVGPAPVSALIHSATMVAAGIILILKAYPLFQAAPPVLDALCWLGGLTAFFSAILAASAYDIKKVLAWSTISHLGKMMLALGLGGAYAAGFHLSTHAWFKSALFLVAGTIDHAAGTRNLREMGGLSSKLPMVAWSFVLASLALSSVPPFSGYWSEEAMLKSAVTQGFLPALAYLVLISLSGIYIARAAVCLFLGNSRHHTEQNANTSKENAYLLFTICLIAALIGVFLHLFGKHLLPFQSNDPTLSIGWKASGLLASLTGLALGAYVAYKKGSAPFFGPLPATLARFVNNFTYAHIGSLALHSSAIVTAIEQQLDRVASSASRTFLHVAHGLNRMEQGADRFSRQLAGMTFLAGRNVAQIEVRQVAMGVDGAAGSLLFLGHQLRFFQNGKIYMYIFGLFVSVLSLGVLFSVLFRLPS